MIVRGDGRLALVACLHGDEKFGRKVADKINSDKYLAPKVRTVVANEEACRINRRYLDTDLNRSFNRGDIVGREAELVPQLIDVLKDTIYLYDIHTTYSANFKAIQIVTALTPEIQMLLSHFDEQDVALISSEEAQYSLIGNHYAGVSLEFGREYAESDRPMELCLEAVAGVIGGGYGKYRKKRIFVIDSLIPADAPKFNPDTKSGDYSEAHEGYVIMPKPTKLTDYQGFLSKKRYELYIGE